jgi:hypothetical protein
MTKEYLINPLIMHYELSYRAETRFIYAMDKYAEQTAIGFSDWQRELVFTENSIWLKEKTTKELYDLYLKTPA